MPRLPVISGREAVRCFGVFGWEQARRHGSHMMLVRVGTTNTLSVPDHRELDRGLLRDLIRRADLTVEEFVEALERIR